MNIESAIEQETEIREQVNELEVRISEVMNRLREAKDSGDAVAFTDANEELANLQGERGRLRRALLLAGETRLRASQAEAKAKAQKEIEETKAALASVFSGPLPGLDELKAALNQFDAEAFKKAGMECIGKAKPLVGKLKTYQVAYRAPWGYGEVADLIKRISAAQAILTKFTGG